MDTRPSPGMADLEHATRVEVERIVKESRGDRITQIRLLLEGLAHRGIIDPEEVTPLSDVLASSFGAHLGKVEIDDALKQARAELGSVLGRRSSTQVAVTLLSSTVSSLQSLKEAGRPIAALAANQHRYREICGIAGAAIGGAFPPAGGAIGAAVGSLIGEIVDDCRD